ncbi:hypothetical protein PMEGAPR236_53050 [Priestia megaterium]
MTTNKKRALFIFRFSFLFTTDNSHYVNRGCIWYVFMVNIMDFIGSKKDL